MENSDWIALLAIFIALCSALFAYKTWRESQRANIINEIAIHQKDYDLFVERYRDEFTKYEQNKNLGDSFAEACRKAAADYQRCSLDTEEKLKALRAKL
ncbi:hypothetical protein BCT04_01390 [Vibrio breoganii]|uniref:hypothetical protein n=1 Tax=Vibrio breoganii TaxID=553239 RepID=UPI000C82D1FC|nr:hypothetical protein [Vibrio breoganii]PMK32047.1 hypothetical protein BCU03_05920 [Vibrio breoganii]PMO65104.1 hypothetical protein BCT04_01390 [Vibrio breoganii]